MSVEPSSSPERRRPRRRMAVLGSLAAVTAVAGAALASAQTGQQGQQQQGQQQPPVQQPAPTTFRAVTVPTENRARTIIVPPCPTGQGDVMQAQQQQVQNLLAATGQQQAGDRRDQQRERQRDRTRQRQGDQRDRQGDRRQRQGEQRQRQGEQRRRQGEQRRRQGEQRQRNQAQRAQDQGRGQGILLLDESRTQAGTNVTVVPGNTGQRTILVPTCGSQQLTTGQNNGVTVLVLPGGTDPQQLGLPIVDVSRLAEENRSPGVIIPPCVPSPQGAPLSQQAPQGERAAVAPFCQTAAFQPPILPQNRQGGPQGQQAPPPAQGNQEQQGGQQQGGQQQRDQQQGQDG